ncbi:MAG TPA: choice-of-anchor tandem repeat GloVer-containing protein [Terriglobales bacterium]|nr:choice-of-anchor tandem repeat GloVer-containing protein [Terriglobales bacterium]
MAALIMDAAGNLYGTNQLNGAFGYGTIFKLDTSGNETVLHSFTGDAGDGCAPIGALIMDNAGNLYGTTEDCNLGTVFKLDTSGTYTVLHSFTGSDGEFPSAALIMDSAGNLYSTTLFGGASGCGTVFKLDSFGNETVLHSFAGSDGATPTAGLIMDAAGNLYGPTAAGGSGSCAPLPHSSEVGCGTVFKLDTSGNETILHSFTGGSDGANPDAGLIMDKAGNLYGTATGGGSSNCFGGCGTVFKLTLQTPQQATQAIVNSVNALFSQGVLNGGQDNSLVVKLQHAIDLMNAGKNAAAIGNLNAFISEVNDLLSSGVLSPSQAASLVSAAESVIARLS